MMLPPTLTNVLVSSSTVCSDVTLVQVRKGIAGIQKHTAIDMCSLRQHDLLPAGP